jgi:hypothetical protein
MKFETLATMKSDIYCFWPKKDFGISKSDFATAKTDPILWMKYNQNIQP